MIEVRKKQGESASNLLFNFTKRIKRSGILREARKRRFYARKLSRVKRKSSALHREDKRQRMERAKKLGVI